MSQFDFNELRNDPDLQVHFEICAEREGVSVEDWVDRYVERLFADRAAAAKPAAAAPAAGPAVARFREIIKKR